MSLSDFDLHDGDKFHRDEFGDDFAAPEAARRQARSLLHDIMREEPPANDMRTVACNVRDGMAPVVYGVELTYRETCGPV